MIDLLTFVRRVFSTMIAIGFLAGLWSMVGCVPSTSGTSTSNAPATGEKKLPTDEELQQQLDEVLEFTCHNRRLNAKVQAAWQIVHGALAFGREFVIDDLNGQPVHAVKYLMNGGELNGWKLKPGVMLPGNPPRQGLESIMEAGSLTGEGHADQWLGYLADCNLALDETIKVGQQTFTLEDMLRQAEHDVPFNPDREYSWTLMAMTKYRPTDYKWIAGDGKEWTIPQLMETELQHDIHASACGGTHRMCGITLAVNRHKAAGGKLEGVWLQAQNRIDALVDAAKKYQNGDGSLSANWLARPGSSPDLAQSLRTTGHALEFIVLASSDEQLREPWVQRAALSLCGLFRKTKSIDLECGALYHAAHGLVLYRQRLFGERSYGDDSEPSIQAEPNL